MKKPQAGGPGLDLHTSVFSPGWHQPAGGIMRIALFARYSSKLQDELSLDAQIAEMENYVGKQPGWFVTQRFLLPETRSCELERAPEFQEMVSAARRKDFDVLLVHKLDRFGRDRESAVIHKAMLRRLGIQVRSVVENLGDSIMERAMEGMLEVMAEWYGANLGQETRKGQRQLTRRGLWRGGKVPFGLVAELVMDGSQPHKRLVPCPKNGPILVGVFQQFAEGKATGEVMDWVLGQTGERWCLATLYTRLKNPLYKGVIQYGRTAMPQGRKRKAGEELTETSWAGLVTPEIWEAANATIRGRAHVANGQARAKKPYLFSGLITCSRCRGSIIGGSFGGERRYSCGNRRQKICTNSSISAELFESEALEHLGAYLASVDPDDVVRAYRASEKPALETSQVQEKRLRKRLTEVRTKLKNLLEALENGIFFDDLQARIKTLKAEESELAQEIATCQLEAERNLTVTSAFIRSWVDRIRTDLLGQPTEDQRILVKHLLTVEYDLVERKGELLLQLPSGEGQSPCVWFGRSARIRIHPRKRSGFFIRVPFRPRTLVNQFR